MAYEGLATLLFRFVGFLLVGFTIFGVVPAAFSATSQVAPSALATGATLIPAVVLIIASKPLAKLVAAGIE